MKRRQVNRYLITIYIMSSLLSSHDLLDYEFDSDYHYILDASTLQSYQIDLIRKLVSKHTLRLYLKCPEIINIARGDDLPTKQLLVYIQQANEMGCCGVLIGTGRSFILNVSRAMENYTHQLQILLGSVIYSCPLLLQSTLKKTTELLSHVPDLFEFVRSMEDLRVGICLNADHVTVDQLVQLKKDYVPIRLFVATSDSKPKVQYYSLAHHIPICMI